MTKGEVVLILCVEAKSKVHPNSGYFLEQKVE